MSFSKLKGFAAAVLVFAFIPSISSACEEKAEASNEEIRACLNDFAQNVLAGRVAFAKGITLPELFEEDFRERLEAYQFPGGPDAVLKNSGNAKITPLSEQYRITLPRLASQSDRKLSECFDFNQTGSSALRSRMNRAMIRVIKAQILEAALFLKNYHVRSFGRQGSHLFQINEIRICGAHAGEQPRFKEHVLTVPPKVFHPVTVSMRDALGRSEIVTTATELEQGWDDGSISLGLETSSAKILVMKVVAGKAALLHEAMRKIWRVLNPTGTARTQIRYEIEKSLLARFNTATPSRKRQLLEIISQSGANLASVTGPFSSAGTGLSERQAERILAEWKKELQDPSLKEKIFEQAVIHSAAGGTDAQVIDERDALALISVRNNKQIVVDTQFAMGGDDLDVKKYLAEESRELGPQVKLTLKSTVKALIAVDLSDQVVVNVQLPTGLSKLMAKMTLDRVVGRVLAEDQLSDGTIPIR